MIVKVGNIFYWLYILISVFIFFVFYFFLVNKNEKTKDKTIKIILFVNLAVHFCKLFFEPYRSNLPYSIRKVTFENICAVTTLIYPFVYLSKKRWLNNYLFFISLLGGLGAIFFPTEALNKFPFAYDTMRFYFCHITLLIVPLLLGSLKIYTPDYKKIWLIPLCFLGIQLIILINEIILIKLGFVQSNINEFFDRNCRNSAFIFGPTKEFDKISWILTMFCPSFLKTNFWNLDIDQFYFPILWIVIPAFFYLPITYVIVTLPFNLKIKIRKSEEKENDIIKV